jgi:DNA-binding response OmpR family regulator
MGADDVVECPLDSAVLRARVRGCLERRRLHRQSGRYQQELQGEQRRFDDLVRAVIPIGVALMAERDFDRLLEMILEEAQRLCNADGGTLYLRTGVASPRISQPTPDRSTLPQAN